MGDLDAVIIANGTEPFLDSTFWYLTEQMSGSFEGSIAMVHKDGTLDVIVSQLEEEIARSGTGELHVYKTGQEYKDILTELLKDCKKVGVNSGSISYSAIRMLRKVREDLEFEDASGIVSETVNVKDGKEVACIRKACEITSKVANELPSMISEGVSEKEVAAEMDIRMRRYGGTGNAFDTIAAFGKYSAEPHHMPCDYRLKKGDTALFDFGAKYDRYCADLTRSIFLDDPGDTMRRVYEIVLKAQQAGIDTIRPGVNAEAVDAAAREVIDSTEFKGRFIHSFGHGIGMDVHQEIHVSPRSKHVLKEGNIISAEPGIYVPGVGGVRIEDTILVTKDGCERLTSFDHSFTISR